jgi:HSP20 family molecular chaperone IbpA
MHTTVELMRDQVRAIYRALTGDEMPEATASEATVSAESPDISPEISMDEVARRFADLEAMARRYPVVTEKVPPFSFAPPIDACDDGQELVIEIAVPGVRQEDVEVTRSGDLLTITGLRNGSRISNGRNYFIAEIPRGPFHRALRLPYAVVSEPRVEIDSGILRIRLAKTPVPSARA